MVRINGVVRFRIISIPRGQAPEEVRKEWIGIVLPLKNSFYLGEGRRECNFSGKLQPERSFVTVPMRVALKELARKSNKAAEWFYDNLPEPMLAAGDFTFGIEEVEILEPN